MPLGAAARTTHHGAFINPTPEPAMHASLAAPPRRIVDIVGATFAPARLSDAVLLVIDAQREYVDGKLPLAGMDAALAVGVAAASCSTRRSTVSSRLRRCFRRPVRRSSKR